MDLVILAAGMGSRFGGLKQIEPIDKYGNFIIDYSIYDAIEAGFDRVIFIIKEENLEIFKKTIGTRIENKIKTYYAFQKLNNIPNNYVFPESRIKPLGTAHAIYCAKDLVSEKFIIINADDYYGKDAFKVAAKFLNSLPNDSKNNYANVAYKVINTITENGSVKRGVLKFDNHSCLQKMIESSIEKKNTNQLIATPLDKNIKPFSIDGESLVSMNMFAFTKDIMQHIENGFSTFFKENINNLNDCEYLIPSVVSSLIEKNIIKVNILSTTSIWYGVTYKEDKQYVYDSLNKMQDCGMYPQGLWKK